MRIHHLALRTGDVGRLVAFYAGVLGLDPHERASNARSGAPDREDRRAWLAIGDAVIMIEAREGSEPAVPDGSKELIAFTVTEAEREGWRARLAKAGVAVEARTEHTLYFRDPDGRRVAVSSYPL